MKDNAMRRDWEAELAQLLTDLSETQDELLSLLREKQQRLAISDVEALDAMLPRQQRLHARLQDSLDRRKQLLARAAAEGLAAQNLRSLATALPHERRAAVEQDVRNVSDRCRLLTHHSLTNWVLAQRTLLHLSQLIEIIATGGRPRPTYDKGQPATSTGSLGTGSLVDRAA